MKGWKNNKIDGTTDDVIVILVDCWKQTVILYAELDESGLFRTRLDAGAQYSNLNWNKIINNRDWYKIVRNKIDYCRY